MSLYFVLVFAFAKATFGDDGEVTFVSELSSKAAQKLSKYGWYGNARLQRFHIPEETAVARWIFTVTKGHSFDCAERNVTIHVRQSAPPVVNPTGTAFPNVTLWRPPHSLILPVTSLSVATFNVSDPAPGDWFVAAHLPEDDGRIEQKGFPSCSYFFQPQLSVRRAIDTPVLQTGASLRQTARSDEPARLKLYVPQFASSLSVSVADCSSAEVAGSASCSLVLSLGSDSLLDGPVRVKCSGTLCSASVADPPWDTWLRVVVESSEDNRTVTFSIASNYTEGCKPKSEGLAADNVSGLHSNSSNTKGSAATEVESASACVGSVPVGCEEDDFLSLRCTPVNGPGVGVRRTRPALLTYPLPAQATGATLNLQLTLNTTNVTPGNSSSAVAACLSPRAPILRLGADVTCRTAFFEGYGVKVNSSFPKSALRLPFPASTMWYLTLQLTCDGSDCGSESAVWVEPELFVSACVDDCGAFGECRLLRSYNYLYGACACKAGWRGWACTDGSAAQSPARQLAATLLLTLSNAAFLPAVAVAVKRGYVAEACVYLFTMFFSTFYHACDQPGIAVLCIMSYDALQYCDFLGSVCSVWVTVLCMACLRNTVKYTLFVLGTLLIAMSLQLDRKGLWNLLAPILAAVVLLLAVWAYRGIRRRRCYFPPWQRWVFYLIPGGLCALVGVCLYVFAETEDNYLYTHSIWHILVATCVVFLLPPRERSLAAQGWRPDWNWMRRCVCRTTLCPSSKDELYTVT
ncbi:post-GPI attachment to proteins factor 6 [Syngnathoides biaculeatus]|uniref:post-GPI attachment to proteins factor 6 n=1 Tax=Syngnathoides biaculeatus TaxID=300417 RepID=UPI002ADE11E6|nr:post-GPI attachment to proteins factor 6 [Syngnathoides biaculeatus]